MVGWLDHRGQGVKRSFTRLENFPKGAKSLKNIFSSSQLIYIVHYVNEEIGRETRRSLIKYSTPLKLRSVTSSLSGVE